MVLRAQIVLAAAQVYSNARIARDLRMNVDTVRLWRDRWVALQGIELSRLSVAERLQDAPRPGAKPTFSEEQRCQIAALACEATKWHLIMDNLNIHQSESLVRFVAEREGIAAETLGIKGTSGIFRSMESRAAFLHDPAHQVVFYYTTKHASWMNQVEIWLSTLVRKLLKRGNFRSLHDLRDQILAFIAYYNRTMAKPIKWTYTGLSPDRGSI